ncbi:hypothetical protein DAEQUDRAFT_426038 [Daedalea quercina L-15889]|uniref:Cyclin N-terminal domain-containing protein n=1 Tax=Daedalea quercina L-15889 TaxID=1314783 RepID=A0A165NHL9_9APHY|nr:hypothetical protein DAEQUDRAFT_426038 [Daedalea quercina L-15889]
MPMQEERPGRAMRRTRDEHRKRPSRRSKQRDPNGQGHLATAQPEDLKGCPFDYVATAEICKNFLRHTLQPVPLDESRPPPYTCPLFGVITVHEFIYNLLRNTRFPECVAFAGLFLLHRLKCSGVVLDVNDAYTLFLGAYIIAAKVHVDDSFCNAYWVVLGGRHFKLEELNRCERELCGLLQWDLLVDPLVMEKFTKAVKRDFHEDGPYPNYSLDEDLSNPVKGFPQLPGSTVDQDEEELPAVKPANAPPPEIVAALARHRKPAEDSKPLPPLPIGPPALERETSACAISYVRPPVGELSQHRTLPVCKDASATWLPLTALSVPGYVLNTCYPV